MYERIIYEDESYQWRVTVSKFRDIEYFNLRKYVLDFEGTWIPIKEGVSFPLDLNNVKELFIALLEILSLGESKQAIQEYFSELLNSS